VVNKLGRIQMEVVMAIFCGIIHTSDWENLESNENFRHNQCPHPRFKPSTFSFIYLHSTDPYMTGRPVDIEIVKDNRRSPINYVNKN
jgi:hypothetical protein